MATKKTEEAQESQKEEVKRGRYYIVNKSGTVHEVTYDHAKTLLGKVGYRMATGDEVDKYRSMAAQNLKNRIAEPFVAEPEPTPEPEAVK